ncbi:hypothetical protein ACIA78_08915 [Streptomyces xanthochromogenes]|uniref:hypothetical protein n=1 Tax=Streptomyces xanthochromogenes TaxID=67384 RepID=UPI0037A7808A
MSSRRLAVLVKHLPRDSAVNRDLHGEAVEWDSSTHLLAAAVDHLAVANWMTATINSGEDADPLDYPEAVPRPAFAEATPRDDAEEALRSERASETPPSAAQLARFFG